MKSPQELLCRPERRSIDADHGERDPGFFAAGQQFVVSLARRRQVESQAKGALHDPAPCEDLEAAWAGLGGGSLDFTPVRGPRRRVGHSSEGWATISDDAAQMWP